MAPLSAHLVTRWNGYHRTNRSKKKDYQIVIQRRLERYHSSLREELKRWDKLKLNSREVHASERGGVCKRSAFGHLKSNKDWSGAYSDLFHLKNKQQYCMPFKNLKRDSDF